MGARCRKPDGIARWKKAGKAGVLPRGRTEADLGRVEARGEPLDLGGGDDLLGVGGQFAQERRTAGEVEFAEDVIEEQQRRGSEVRLEKAGCGKAQREGEGALLSFGAEGRGVA
ncbi:MAG: hypothetical protein RLZZ244_2277 [Verrucomicrobiota bacterium]